MEFRSYLKHVISKLYRSRSTQWKLVNHVIHNRFKSDSHHVIIDIVTDLAKDFVGKVPAFTLRSVRHWVAQMGKLFRTSSDSIVITDLKEDDINYKDLFNSCFTSFWVAAFVIFHSDDLSFGSESPFTFRMTKLSYVYTKQVMPLSIRPELKVRFKPDMSNKYERDTSIYSNYLQTGFIIDTHCTPNQEAMLIFSISRPELEHLRWAPHINESIDLFQYGTLQTPPVLYSTPEENTEQEMTSQVAVIDSSGDEEEEMMQTPAAKKQKRKEPTSAADLNRVPAKKAKLEKEMKILSAFLKESDEGDQRKLTDLEVNKVYHVHNIEVMDPKLSKFKKFTLDGNPMGDTVYKICTNDNAEGMYRVFGNTRMNKVGNDWQTLNKFKINAHHCLMLHILDIKHEDNKAYVTLKMFVANSKDVKCTTVSELK